MNRRIKFGPLLILLLSWLPSVLFNGLFVVIEVPSGVAMAIIPVVSFSESTIERITVISVMITLNDIMWGFSISGADGVVKDGGWIHRNRSLCVDNVVTHVRIGWGNLFGTGVVI